MSSHGHCVMLWHDLEVALRIEDVIGRRIAEGREELKLTQAQIGEQVGRYLGKPWPRQAVSNAEKGGRSFGAADLVALSLVLGCTIETLLEPPPDVESVLIGDGPPLDSRHLRAAASTNSDLKQLAEVMTELRHTFPDLTGDVRRSHLLMERAYRELWTAIRGRGIEADEEALADARNARWAAAAEDQP